MTLFANWAAGLKEKNTETLAACLHDDFEFVRHQTGTTMNKAEMIEMFKVLRVVGWRTPFNQWIKFLFI